MDALTAIHTRRSLPRLALPVPSAAQLAGLFEAAACAPDHRLLRPWRYLVISGDGLAQLGAVFVDAIAQQDPVRAAAEGERFRQMPQRAPMIIVAILSIEDHPGVPEWEQWLSLGASVQNLLLALHAQGFAGMWRTGDMATNTHVCSALGLAAHERIGGLIYVGSAVADKAAPAAPKSVWSQWPAL
ncbi:nitroreductase [Paraperlucidibaca baekdonensis]|uniref:Putative NAD(P)H nitroreductase n=1 Tax=Paraperlucidibaca baekdonensis TaxID=748120 RepID=A0A3E0H352_9GAMM|nr:nitroreductase [Paraperlucidibaca baekdonensis]REH36695.1 nitroreductase [Paraperlucidibaca baekdonensis]